MPARSESTATRCAAVPARPPARCTSAAGQPFALAGRQCDADIARGVPDGEGQQLRRRGVGGEDQIARRCPVRIVGDDDGPARRHRRDRAPHPHVGGSHPRSSGRQRPGETTKPAAVEHQWWCVRVGAQRADLEQHDGVIARRELRVHSAVPPRARARRRTLPRSAAASSTPRRTGHRPCATGSCRRRRGPRPAHSGPAGERFRSLGHVVEVFCTQIDTSGGCIDTGVNELAAIPTGSPSTHRADRGHPGREATENPAQFDAVRRAVADSSIDRAPPGYRSPCRKSSSSRLVSLGSSC